MCERPSIEMCLLVCSVDVARSCLSVLNVLTYLHVLEQVFPVAKYQLMSFLFGGHSKLPLFAPSPLSTKRL